MKRLCLLITCLLLAFSLSAGLSVTDAQEPDPPAAPAPRPPLPLDGVLDPALFASAPGADPPPAESEERASAAMGDPALWTRIAFQSLRDGNWEIYVADGEAKNQVRLTYGSASDIHPRLNRGCTRLVFASDREGQYELYSMRPDGSGLARLTNNNADDVNPAWSPDGTRIAFQSYRDGQPEIYVMNADGSSQRRLTAHGEFDANPTWSPDGTQIAFISRRTGGYRIWAMNADGSNQRQLSDQPYSENPAWSPDGKTIAYDANADGDLWQELWLMDADGSNQWQAFKLSGNQDVWVRSWAPYGSAVAFTRAQWYEHKGYWYLDSIRLSHWASGGSGDFEGSGNRDMDPDWQTLDVQPPRVTLNPLPAYVRADQEVRLLWSADDAGGSALKSYDLQYQDLSGTAWVDLKMDTEEQFASFTGMPGHRYRFRVRARDSAYNVSRWSAPDGADTVTFYTWAVSGTARDARGAPLRGVQVQTDPPAFEAPPSDVAGAYKAYVAGEAGTYGVAWSKPGYVGLPTTTLNGVQDAEFVDEVLPSGDNLLPNWGFERGVLDGTDWVPGGVVSPTVTDENQHTGRYAARLGQPPLEASERVGDSTLSQAVQIPAAMTYPTLSLWYEYESSAPASTHWFGAEVDDGSQVHQFFTEAENWYRWQHRWFDMSPWAGQTVTITLRVHQSPDDPRAWAYVDEVSLASIPPDLWIEKAGRQTAALPGQTVIYALIYGNRGRVPAQDVRLTDTLPPELTYVGADPAPTTTGATLAWELGDLAAESGPYTIVLTTSVAADAARGNSTPNLASITSATTELDTTNNVAQAPLWVGGRLYLPLTIKE